MIKILSFSLICFLSATPLLASKNKTEIFAELYHNPQEKQSLIKRLQSQHVIIVPGLFDSFAKPFYSWRGDYKEYKDFFERHAISYEILHTYSQREVEENHQILLDAIKKAPEQKSIFILAHSFGGLISLSTLLKHKEVYPRIAAIMTMQTPYYGSLIADYFYHGKLAYALACSTFALTGGSVKGFVQFHRDLRVRWLEENKAELIELTKKIPLLQIATISDYLQFPFVFHHFSNEDSDGLLETSTQYFTFGSSSYAILKGWTHEDTIKGNNGREHLKREHLLLAALNILFDRKREER